jgi:predicted Rossmann fold nucleotide-binding protein DprA/Smf involved in DNA uptake
MTVLPNIAIISGGQTGADRAALDFAIEYGLSHGGWCPRQRRAEDGVIAAQYLLQETPSSHYAQRTEWNVRDSDATVVFSIQARLTGGTRLTFELATRRGKPVLHLSRDELDTASAAGRLCAFVEKQHVRTLNVAGPRSWQEAEIGAFVHAVFAAAFGVGK